MLAELDAQPNWEYHSNRMHDGPSIVTLPLKGNTVMSEGILEGAVISDKPAPVESRGRKKGQKAKDRTISADDFGTIEEVPADERGFTRRQRGERGAQQQATDLMVLNVRKEWRSWGSPTDWNRCNVKRWPTSKAGIENVLFQLRKAAALHGAKLIIGNISDKDPEGKFYPDKKWRVPFIVVDRRTAVTGAPESNESSYGETA